MFNKLTSAINAAIEHDIKIHYHFTNEALNTIATRNWLSTEQRNALTAVQNRNATKDQCATLINAMRRDSQLAKMEGKLFSAIAK